MVNGSAMDEAALTLELADEEATLNLGKTLGGLLGAGSLVLMSGELGAGKTVLARGLARGLGVDESYAIVSPTFTLFNVYPGRLTFFHADLYRLEEGDVEEMDLVEQAAGGVLTVEWAERAEGLWQSAALRVDLSGGDGRRRAAIRGPKELVGRLKAALDEYRRNEERA